MLESLGEDYQLGRLAIEERKMWDLEAMKS